MPAHALGADQYSPRRSWRTTPGRTFLVAIETFVKERFGMAQSEPFPGYTRMEIAESNESVPSEQPMSQTPSQSS